MTAGRRRATTHGYVEAHCPAHPNPRRGGFVLEHRLVVEERIGRYLHADERIHHKNGDRADNRNENLELWVRGRKDPQGARASDLWQHLERSEIVQSLDEHTRVALAMEFARAFGFADGNV